MARSQLKKLRIREIGLACLIVVTTACATPSPRSPRSQPDAPASGTAIWRGFKQSWTYNHRLNRIGDYVTVDCGTTGDSGQPERRCGGEVVHTAASGTGADTAEFRSHYTRVTSPTVGFQTGRVELRVDGREQRDLRVEHDLQIPADGRLRKRDHYTVLLNGFDIYADGRRAKAKKVQRLRLWTRGEADYDAAQETVDAEIGALLNMNCDSIECKQQSNRVRYTIDVRYVVVAYDESVRKTTKPFEIAYSWDKKHELKRSDLPGHGQKRHIKGVKEDFPTAVLGFREIDFNLGKKGRSTDHWFVTWAHAIHNVDYDPTTGRAAFELDLFFKEWNRRAKKKLTSLARKGNAALRADIALLQFEDARVERHSTSGTIEWKGRNRPAASDKAVWRSPFEMNL